MKFAGNILKIYGNILKDGTVGVMIPGNKLQENGDLSQIAGKKLKGQEENLKILGNELIFVEIFRQNGESVLDCGMGNRVVGEGAYPDNRSDDHGTFIFLKQSV